MSNSSVDFRFDESKKLTSAKNMPGQFLVSRVLVRSSVLRSNDTTPIYNFFVSHMASCDKTYF